MSLPYQTSPNVSKISKEWNYSVNSIYDGDTITSASEKKTSGKEHSKHIKDYLSQK